MADVKQAATGEAVKGAISTIFSLVTHLLGEVAEGGAAVGVWGLVTHWLRDKQVGGGAGIREDDPLATSASKQHDIFADVWRRINNDPENGAPRDCIEHWMMHALDENQRKHLVIVILRGATRPGTTEAEDVARGKLAHDLEEIALNYPDFGRMTDTAAVAFGIKTDPDEYLLPTMRRWMRNASREILHVLIATGRVTLITLALVVWAGTASLEEAINSLNALAADGLEDYYPDPAEEPAEPGFIGRIWRELVRHSH